jgi:hypothetical protein
MTSDPCCIPRLFLPILNKNLDHQSLYPFSTCYGWTEKENLLIILARAILEYV